MPASSGTVRARRLHAAASIAAVILSVGSARAADDPLLVIVEAPAEMDVDAADVRRRIAIELGQPVISPSDPAAPRASRVMLVALDQHDIRLTMRDGASSRISRTIPDLSEHAARLRAVAWLAGNIARDQVGPLLPNLAIEPRQNPAAEPATTAAAAAPAPAGVEPPAAAAPPPAGSERAVVSVQAGPSDSNVHARWWITASGGTTLTDYCFQLGFHPAVTCGPTAGAASPWASGSTYQLEVQHQTPEESTIIGAALDTGPDVHLVGLAGLIGIRRPWGHWYLEATLAAGIEAQRLNVATSTVTNSSQTGVSSETSVTPQVQPALYARVTGSIGIPINRTFDFMARASVHLASSGGATDFIGASAGLRLKLP